MGIHDMEWSMYKAKMPDGGYIGRGDQVLLQYTGKGTIPRKLDCVWVTVHRVTRLGGIRIMVGGEQFARKIEYQHIQAYKKVQP